MDENGCENELLVSRCWNISFKSGRFARNLPSWSHSSLHLSVMGVPCDFQRMSLGSDRNCSVMRVSMRAPFESRTRSISRTWKNVKNRLKDWKVSVLCHRLTVDGTE